MTQSTSLDICQRYRLFLLEQEELSIVTPAEFEAHLSKCEACRSFKTELESVESSLVELKPSLPDSFESNLLKKLNEIEAYEKRDVKGSFFDIFSWQRVALLAAILLAILSFFIFRANINRSEERIYYQKVNVAIDSSREYRDVDFEIQLPLGIEALVDKNLFADSSKLRWKTVIKPGKNSIALPLKSKSPILEGEIGIRLNAKGLKWEKSIGLSKVANRYRPIRAAFTLAKVEVSHE